MSNTTEQLPSPPTEITAPPVIADAPAPHVNSVDATAHRPLVARIMDRKKELETLLASLPKEDTHAKQDIEAALGAVEPLLSGDLENVPSVVMVDLNKWLERSKHLGERNTTETAAEPVAEPIAAPSA